MLRLSRRVLKKKKKKEFNEVMALNKAASDGQFSNGAGFLLQGRTGGQDDI